MPRTRLIPILLALGVTAVPAGALAAGSGGASGPAFYVDGALYRTVNTPHRPVADGSTGLELRDDLRLRRTAAERTRRPFSRTTPTQAATSTRTRKSKRHSRIPVRVERRWARSSSRSSAP
jgi:hypothetical protein